MKCRSVWGSPYEAVRMGIYGPGFSKADWLIPLSRESVIYNNADYEYAKIFRFVVLDIKLWLRDDSILYQF